MTRRVVDLRGPRPWLDIASRGRAGPTAIHSHRAAITRTVGKVPEVVVKISGGGESLGHVQDHLRYIGRHGRLGVIGDDGSTITTMAEVHNLLTDWGLRTDELQRRQRYSGKPGPAGYLTRNIVFSMPAGTNAKKVRQAVANFARQEWGGIHRYAMVLHEDTPRPHVHVVLRAINEQGQRLYIDRDTLRHWRESFAWNLRSLGVAANATSRAVRGRPGHGPKDKVYRALCRTDSQIVRSRYSRVQRELQKNGRFSDLAGTQVRQTRRAIENDWKGLQLLTIRAGDTNLAEDISTFLSSWPAPLTEAEALAVRLRHEQSSARDGPG